MRQHIQRMDQEDVTKTDGYVAECGDLPSKEKERTTTDCHPALRGILYTEANCVKPLTKREEKG